MFLDASTWQALAIVGAVGGLAGLIGGFIASANHLLGTVLMGGFGGCARDVAEALGLVDPWAASRSTWPGKTSVEAFSAMDLNNGLTQDENETLARTPHVDQAITLILRGMVRVAQTSGNP